MEKKESWNFLGDNIKGDETINPDKNLNTELEECEVKLLDIIEKTRIIINSVHEGIIIYGRDLRYREWNPFIERLSWFKKKDVIGKYPTEIFSTLAKYGVIEKLEKILKEGNEINQEIPLNVIKNNLNWLIVDTSKPLKDSKWNIIGILSIINDITKIRTSEKELIRLNKILKIHSAINKALFEVNTEHELVSKICSIIVNQLGYLMSFVGHKYEECNPIINTLNSESSITFPIIGNDDDIIGELIIHSEETGTLSVEEFNILNELSQDLSRGIQCIRGIEEKKKTDELLKKSEYQLQIRQRMDSLWTLAGGLSHDFNNLLAWIMWNLELLELEKNISLKGQEYIKNALKASEYANDIIKQLQKLSINSISEKKSIDIYPIIKEIFNLLNVKNKNVNKIIDFNEGKFYIKWNASELHQVLLNIWINSLRAIEEESEKKENYFIKVSVDNYDIRLNEINGIQEWNYVHISFQDNWKWMSEEVLNKAFDPLFTTKQKCSEKGGGMGLAMVYNIITKSHKGYIFIDSKEWLWTTLNIFLPKASPSEKSKPEQKEVVNIPHKLNKTILVVDDESLLRDFLKNALELFNYEVITAIDWKDWLEKYKENIELIDLVILDLSMPNIPWQVVFEEMLKIKNDVKVIISSGHSDTELKEWILTNAKWFLKKPFLLNVLSETVEKALINWKQE